MKSFGARTKEFGLTLTYQVELDVRPSPLAMHGHFGQKRISFRTVLREKELLNTYEGKYDCRPSMLDAF